MGAFLPELKGLADILWVQAWLSLTATGGQSWGWGPASVRHGPEWTTEVAPQGCAAKPTLAAKHCAGVLETLAGTAPRNEAPATISLPLSALAILPQILPQRLPPRL